MESNCIIIDGNIFFEKSRLLSKARMLRKMGVKKNSYMENVIERLYDYYFDGAICISKDYKKFYKVEFESIKQFLECKFNLEEELANELSKKSLYYNDIGNKPERNIQTLFYDERIKTLFWENAGGCRSENTDWIRY